MQMVDLGVPVEQLTEFVYGSEIKRLKSSVPNEDLTALREMMQKTQQAFDAMRVEYGNPRGATP
jgi:hypothetical protein